MADAKSLVLGIDGGGFGHHFLNPILPDVLDSRRDHATDHVGGKGLGDGDDRHRIAFATGPLQRRGNTRSHRLHPGNDRIHVRDANAVGLPRPTPLCDVEKSERLSTIHPP